MMTFCQLRFSYVYTALLLCATLCGSVSARQPKTDLGIPSRTMPPCSGSPTPLWLTDGNGSLSTVARPHFNRLHKSLPGPPWSLLLGQTALEAQLDHSLVRPDTVEHEIDRSMDSACRGGNVHSADHLPAGGLRRFAPLDLVEGKFIDDEPIEVGVIAELLGQGLVRQHRLRARVIFSTRLLPTIYPDLFHTAPH